RPAASRKKLASWAYVARRFAIARNGLKPSMSAANVLVHRELLTASLKTGRFKAQTGRRLCVFPPDGVRVRLTCHRTFIQRRSESLCSRACRSFRALDEATSALDYESERAIQQNMRRIAAG